MIRKSSKLFVLISIVSLFLYPVQLNGATDIIFPDPDVTISMDLKDVSLKDMLKVFSIQSGLNFIASSAVQDRTVTLYLDKVPVKEAMEKIFKANNLSYEFDRKSNTIIVKDWGTPQIETETRIFYLKYATVSSSALKQEIEDKLETTEGEEGGGGGTEEEEKEGITEAVRKLLSCSTGTTTVGAGGTTPTAICSVVEDPRTNSLIVTDIPSNMPRIAKLIAALDIPVPQVMLEVEMLDVSKNATEKLGLKFGQTPITLNTVLQGRSIYTKFPFGSPFGSPGKIVSEGIFKVNPSGSESTYTVLLDFLKQQTDTKYLARPRILTLNNQTAEIKITTDETVGVTVNVVTGAAATTTTTPERQTTGVSLRVTPQINVEAGEITMFVVPEVKDVATSSFTITGSTSQYFKDPETRSTKSVIKVKDGETIILGGLFRKERADIKTRLPFFGDIPLIGALFTHRNVDKNKERELLVFITPHIVKESTATAITQAKKPRLPEREQGTVSATVKRREAIINSSLRSIEKSKK